MSDNIIAFHYRFDFADGNRTEFDIKINRDTMTFVNELSEPYPDWAKLEFHQCPHCPLDNRLDKYCPVALSLIGPVKAFGSSLSYEEADVTVIGPDREYYKHTALQEALGSMVGLCMATSGCPVLEKLRPLARFHMPFASADETMYRVLSMYLFAQYIRYKRGSSPDWDLKYLESMYDSIRQVNKSFVTRLQNIRIKDASLNALISLDCFAISVKFSINLDMLEEVEDLFSSYMG